MILLMMVRCILYLLFHTHSFEISLSLYVNEGSFSHLVALLENLEL